VIIKSEIENSILIIQSKYQQVLPNQVPILANWNSNYGLEALLTEIRNQMASSQNRKLSQPAEGSCF
jgi:hypothetical protein